MRGRAARTSPVARFVKFKTILARLGVISGLRVTLAPSLSVKQYICCEISSPAFRSYSSTCSRTGASYSLKPNCLAVWRMWSNNQFLTFISAGSKSLVPEGGSSQKGRGASSVTASAAALSSAFLILSFFIDASLIRSTTFLSKASLPFFSVAFFSLRAAASAAVGFDFGFSTVSDRHSLTSSGLSRAPTSGPPRGICILRGRGGYWWSWSAARACRVDDVSAVSASVPAASLQCWWQRGRGSPHASLRLQVAAELRCSMRSVNTGEYAPLAVPAIAKGGRRGSQKLTIALLAA